MIGGGDVIQFNYKVNHPRKQSERRGRSATQYPWHRLSKITGLRILVSQYLKKGQDQKSDVDAWQSRRNQERSWIDWRFTAADARIKLKRLYPSIPD